MPDTVHKFQISRCDNDIEIPGDAAPLSVHLQGGVPMLWVRLDPDAPKVTRRFSIYGTGHDLDPDAGSFVATFHTDAGLVFHVFERGR